MYNKVIKSVKREQRRDKAQRYKADSRAIFMAQENAIRNRMERDINARRKFKSKLEEVA